MNILSFIRFNYTIPVLLVLLGVLATVGIVSAQGQAPGAPTNVRVTATDTEATITWESPVVGEGDCAPTDYEAMVYPASGDETILGSEVASPWIVTGLEPSTAYTVAIFTYGSQCDEYSGHTIARFTTAASDASDEVMPTEKHAPNRVRRLRVTPGDTVQGEIDGMGTGTATVFWRAPRTKNGKHYAATDYSIEVVKVTDNGSKTIVQEIDKITDTNIDVDNLTAGTYKFRVVAYNSECNCWGKWKSVRYQHR